MNQPRHDPHCYDEQEGQLLVDEGRPALRSLIVSSHSCFTRLFSFFRRTPSKIYESLTSTQDALRREMLTLGADNR
jgi:hypothetical protein